jgi:hypothetical protein
VHYSARALTFGATFGLHVGMERSQILAQTVRAAKAPSSLANRLRPESNRIRSAVTNGERTFVIGDGNSPWARRQRDLLALHIVDLGGEERLSENQLSLCRRAATLETELEMLEGQLSLGKVADLDLYNRLSGNLRRILESIGLERVARPVNDGSQALADYFSRPPPKEAAP